MGTIAKALKAQRTERYRESSENGQRSGRQQGNVSRRAFMQGVGSVGSLAMLSGLSACNSNSNKHPSEEQRASNDLFKGTHEYYAACPPECQHHNLKALVKDGKVVKVECGAENESFPCMMGRSRVEWLNSDERLTRPLIRDGEKGENKWREIEWDEALDLVANKLTDAIDTVGNAGIVCDYHAGNFNAIAGSAAPAFMSRIGGGTTLTGTLCCAAMNGATTPVFGKRYFDTRNTIDEANYIIVWGNNPAVTMNGYFPRFLRMKQKGGRLVTIDPVYTATAEKSDDWVPIKPTTDTALALGMLKVIVDEGLENRDFLKRHSTAPCLVDDTGALVLIDSQDPQSYAVIDSATGIIMRHDADGVDPVLSTEGTDFAEWYSTVYDITIRECALWTPQAVEDETGVPAAKVIELARDYATAEKAMIIQNMGGFMRIFYGTYAVASQNNLAVFTGHIGAPGTGLCDAGGINNLVKLSPLFENPEVDSNLPKIPRVQFAQHVLNDDPNEIKVFISSRESPMTQFPNTGLLKKALKKIPFVVVIDSFMTSTALYADLVLPCAVVFETEDILCNGRSHCIQLSQKAVDPPGEAHDDLWIFSQLAKRMGVGEDFDHDNEYFVRKALEGTEYSYEWLQRKHSVNAYPKDFIPYADGEFYTKTNKAEIYQTSWMKKGLKPVPSYYRAAESVGGSSGLDKKYPLAVVQRKLNRSVHSTFSPLHLIANATRDHACILMNTQDAAQRDIVSGNRVVVFNDRGEHHAEAIVTDLIMQGVICAENGWREQDGGSSSYVTNDASGPIAGEHCCNETLADVRKEY